MIEQKKIFKFRIQIHRKPTIFDAFFEHNLVFTFGCTHFAVQDFEMFPCYTNFDVVTFKSHKSFCTQYYFANIKNIEKWICFAREKF